MIKVSEYIGRVLTPGHCIYHEQHMLTTLVGQYYQMHALKSHNTNTLI